MKKLLFVFTGGTIGSTVKGNYISTDSNKPYVLIENYKKKYGEFGEYDILSPYTVLSENLSGKYISALIKTVKENGHKYSGVIVTHGTDTLAYSAAALSYSLGNKFVPVCIVSANLPLENPLSNGYDNLRGAINFIDKIGKGGVWVSYKNDDGVVRIHRGSRLLQQACFSHNVSSIKESYFGHFNSRFEFVYNSKFEEDEDKILPIEVCLPNRCENVMKIEQYPSMIYPEVPFSVKYVIISSYHSGTIDTMSKESKTFFEKLRQRGVKVFLVGADEGVQYESTSLYSEFCIIPLPCISPVSALVKLWMLTISKERNPDTEMMLSLSGDIV